MNEMVFNVDASISDDLDFYLRTLASDMEMSMEAIDRFFLCFADSTKSSVLDALYPPGKVTIIEQITLEDNKLRIFFNAPVLDDRQGDMTDHVRESLERVNDDYYIEFKTKITLA